MWSHHLQLSYFDHPPAVSWLMWLGQIFENVGSAVRWPSVILGHLILFVWYYILKDFVSTDHIKKVWIAILLNPFLGLGSVIVTPDLPVLFFWALATLFTLKALQSQRPLWYVLLGISLGLGFCSKYHIVLFVPAALLFLGFSKEYKRIAWRYLPLTVVAGFIGSLPVLIWNYQNEFASFKFQLNHGLHGESYEFIWTWGYILAQLVLVSPFVWFSFYKAKVPAQLRLVSWLGLFPFAFFLYTSTKGHVEANWPIIGYSSIIVAASFSTKATRYFKKANQFWIFLYALIAVILVTPQLRQKIEKLNEPFVFYTIANEVKNYQPLYGTTYQMASSLWFINKTPVYKLNGASRLDFYDGLPQSYPQQSKFYVLKYKTQSLPTWLNEADYSVKDVKEINNEFTLLEVLKK